MALYRQHVLGEKAPEGGGFVPLKSLATKPTAKADETREEVVGD
jgi:hypothetical protein